MFIHASLLLAKLIRGPRRSLLFFGVVSTIIALSVMGGIGLYRVVFANSVKLIPAYQYRFERPPAGKVIPALQQEIAFYQTRIQRDPTGGLDLAALARAYLQMARASGEIHWYLLAEESARRSLANLPYNNDGAVLMLARIAEARHDFSEAIRLSDTISHHTDALAIKVTSYLAMGKLSMPENAAKELLEKSPTLMGHVLYALVKNAQGKDDETKRHFDDAFALEEPGETASSMWARTLLARWYARRGHLAEARALYQEVLRVLPQYQFAIVNLAELELREKDFTAAWNHFAQIFVIAKGNPTVFDHIALRGMARVKRLQGDPQKAQELYAEAESVMRRDVQNFGHRRELARLLLERGRPIDIPEALALLEAELQVRRDAETLDSYAWALMKSEKTRQAKSIIEEVIASGAREAPYFYRAALIEKTIGNQTQAVRYVRLALETDPAFDEPTRQALGLGLETQ